MHRTRKIVKMSSLLLILTVFLMLRAHGQSFRDTLESGFVNPPDSAKPRVWWHWMNGNITKEGIDRKSTRLNSSHGYISYAVFCLKKKKSTNKQFLTPQCV